MSESFDLPQVDRLTADAVGPPGQRVFYLQARRGAELVSLKLEKQQVAALAGYLTAMLADLPAVAGAGADDPGGNMGLEEPVDPAWTVGSIGVAYDEPTDRIVILIEELVEEGEDGAATRMTATREQVAALVHHSNEVVEAGRPPCPLCGLPLDPEGHVCPRLNGHGAIT